MKIGHYILNPDGTTTEVDLLTWAAWFENFENRRVAYYEREGYWVSTVFLGIDHNWGKGPPLLFETMVFSDVREQRKWPGSERTFLAIEELGDLMNRYSTKDDALIGHQRFVKELNRRLDAARDLAADVIKKKQENGND